MKGSICGYFNKPLHFRKPLNQYVTLFWLQIKLKTFAFNQQLTINVVVAR